MTLQLPLQHCVSHSTFEDSSLWLGGQSLRRRPLPASPSACRRHSRHSQQAWRRRLLSWRKLCSLPPLQLGNGMLQSCSSGSFLITAA